MTYRIIPLILSKYVGEKGYMTFLTDYVSIYSKNSNKILFTR